MAQLPSLSVIIPNYNGEKLLAEFLPSVLEAAGNYKGPAEVIVVDDCSLDGSHAVAERLVSHCPKARLVKLPVNGGFSKTCNAGARAASGGILFFLNNDVKLDPRYFDTFPGYFNSRDVFALSPCGYNYYTGAQIDGAKRISWKRGFPRFTENVYNSELPNTGGEMLSAGVQGAYFFADAAKFRELGGFDEIYSPYILEETDLAYRALKRGWKILYGPEFKAYHRVSSSVSSKTSRRVRIISERNRLLFTWKNIHSGRLLAGHIVFLALRLVTLNLTQWSAFIKALKLLPEMLAGRRRETGLPVTDAGLLDFYTKYFAGIRRRA